MMMMMALVANAQKPGMAGEPNKRDWTDGRKWALMVLFVVKRVPTATH
jgi:hypothetical protein